LNIKEEITTCAFKNLGFPMLLKILKKSFSSILKFDKIQILSASNFCLSNKSAVFFSVHLPPVPLATMAANPSWVL